MTTQTLTQNELDTLETLLSNGIHHMVNTPIWTRKDVLKESYDQWALFYALRQESGIKPEWPVIL